MKKFLVHVIAALAMLTLASVVHAQWGPFLKYHFLTKERLEQEGYQLKK